MEDVPKSYHSLFIRGFPPTMEMTTIREFFTKYAGHCSFDFFKTSADQTRLFTAVRFDTHEIAKEMMTRFNRKEVLGSIISMDWFKDVRRFAPYAYSRGNGANARGATSSRNFFGRGMSRGGAAVGYKSTSNSYYSKTNDFRRDDRKRDRRSRSGSSSSRSKSRSSRSYDDESYRRDQRTRYRSRSRSSSKSSEYRDSKSSKYSRTAEMRRSEDSPPRAYRRRTPASPPPDNYRTSNSSFDSRRIQLASTAIDDNEHDDMRETQNSMSIQLDADSSKRQVSVNNDIIGQSATNTDKYDTYGSISQNETPTAAISTSNKQFFNQSSFSLPPKLRYFHSVNIGARNELNTATNDMLSSSSMDQRTTVTPPYQINPLRQSALKPRMMSTTEKLISNEFRSRNDKNDEDSTLTATVGKNGMDHYAVSQFNRKNIELGDNRSQQPYVLLEKMNTYKQVFGAPYQESAKAVSDKVTKVDIARTMNNLQEDSLERTVKPAETNSINMIVQEVTQSRATKDAATGSDELKTEATEEGDNIEKSLTSAAYKISLKAKDLATNSDRRKRIDNMSQEQLKLLQTKRQELEISYRQDCETFATVVKMLISKDSTLEEKLVDSLRESLKDIGEKLIDELNEFVDNLLNRHSEGI